MQGIGALRFQYLSKDSDVPTCGYEITDVALELGLGMPIPRVGEFVAHTPYDTTRLSSNTFVVLAVHYEIVRSPEDHGKLHKYRVTVTLGDIQNESDERLCSVRG